MAKALGAAEYIFEGVWTNWKKGPVLGLTLTLSSYHGALLSAAITQLISFAGAQSFQIFRFSLHQMRSTPGQRNYLYHELQVVLRNTSTELELLGRLFWIAKAWWKQRVHVFRHTSPLASTVLVHLVLVIIAGLFIPSRLDAGSEVLSRSQWCGWYNQTYINAIFTPEEVSDEVVRQSMEYQNNIFSIYASIQQHVDICETSVDGCNTLPVRALDFTSSIAPGECPFEASLCHPDIDGMMRFQTEILSSSADLGLNAPKRDRVSFKLSAQCTPLHDRNFVSDWINVPATANTPAYQVADAMYGPSFTSQRNVTSSTTKQYLQCDEAMSIPPYTLSAEFAPPGENLSINVATFDPIPQLRQIYADTYLIMLTFKGFYEQEISDPWFASHVSFNDTNAFCLAENRQVYARDLPITTIGCTQQFELCNADADGQLKSTSCTPPLALSQLKDFMNSPNATILFNDHQRATADRILRAANGASFYYVIEALSQITTAPLQARHLITNIISLPLPSTQWQIEAQYWFTLLLAYLQQISLQISTGQFAPSTDYINTTRPSSEDRLEQAAYELCQSQVILSDSYRSFKFFALITISILCVLIIITGLWIETITRWLRRCCGRGRNSRSKEDMWLTNRDLEMMRIVGTLQCGVRWSQKAPPDIPVAVGNAEATLLDFIAGSWNPGAPADAVEFGLTAVKQRLSSEERGSPHSSEPVSPGRTRYTISREDTGILVAQPL